MRYAWRNEDILKVPPFPKLSYELPEIEYLEFEQQNRIIDEIPQHHRPIFYFMQEYGVRPGEARALMRDCVKDGDIIIKRAFSEIHYEKLLRQGRGGVMKSHHLCRKFLNQ